LEKEKKKEIFPAFPVKKSGRLLQLFFRGL
jgi:hypothetical protein